MEIPTRFKAARGINSRMKIEDSISSHLNQPNEVKGAIYVELPKIPFRFRSENAKRDKPKVHPTRTENFKSYFSQYCAATTIHGIKYIGERGRFAVERIVWTIVVTVLCVLCTNLMMKTYSKWVRSPVVVTFATAETRIWQIPFPAITICPEVKSDPQVFNYTNVMLKKLRKMNISESEEQLFDTFSLVCADIFRDSNISLSENNFISGERVVDDLFRAITGLDPHNQSSLEWLGKKYDWLEILSTSLTKEGLCYSFNMLHYDDIFRNSQKTITDRLLPSSKTFKWSLEEGYLNEDEEDSYPRRTFLPGIGGGFTYDGLFANHSHLDYICTEALQGFKVTLHHPSELPDMDKHFRVPLDQAVYVAIKPRIMYASEELKAYKPEARGCYFANERPLVYFRSYTQQNCLDECLWNYTLSECSCVDYYLTGLDNFTICGPGKNKCLARSKVQYLSNKDSNCNCLPFCTDLRYDVEITQSKWDWYEVFAMLQGIGYVDDEISIAFNHSHFSKLSVFYKDLQFLASTRHELYGYSDFFSNIGGLLGLFIGFSVTSFIEILYFFSLRIVCNVRKFGSNFWSGNQNQ